MIFKSTSIEPNTGMISAPASSSKATAPSILSHDLEVTGNIVTSGELHIDGCVKGDIAAKKVTIGEGGSVTGAIEAEAAFVAGAMSGRLTASTVVLAKTARTEVDITHVSLTIDQGAVFQGHSRRVESIDKAKSASLLVLPASRSPLNGHKNGSASSDNDKGQSAAAAS